MVKKIRHLSKKLDVVGIFLDNYHSNYSGREIARRTKVSPQTALTVINDLVKDKILQFNVSGRNKNYFLNFDDFRTKIFLEQAENSVSLGPLKNFELRTIVSSLLPLSDTLIIFGSFAKNRQKENSDLDLIAIGVKDKRKFESLESTFPREIQSHFLTWKEFFQSMNSSKNHLAQEIKKNHFIFGNVHKVVEAFCL